MADYNILIGSRGYLHLARESPQIATETEEDEEEEEEYDWGDWVQSINRESWVVMEGRMQHQRRQQH